MINLSCRSRFFSVCTAIVLFCSALPVATVAQVAKPLRGFPTVIAGDLLKIDDTLVQLYGIDAPEIKQTCARKTIEYPCGKVAIAGLMDLTAGLKTVSCYPKGRTAEGVLIARCLDPQKFDLSQQMVYIGWALALPDADNLFHQIQGKAQNARRGLWQGHVTPPWRWRAGQ